MGPSSLEQADFLRVRSEGRGTSWSPANVLRVAQAHTPPDCRPKEPQVTQTAPRSRRPSPQAERPRVGLRRSAWTSRPWAARGGVGVVHGVYWIQICIAHASLHALRAGRNAPALPRRRLWVHPLWSLRRSFATKAPHAPQAVKIARVASGEWLHGDGLAILHRLTASVVLRSRQIRRSRN